MTYIEVGAAVAVGGLLVAALNALRAWARDERLDRGEHAASDAERDANIRALNVQMAMQTDMMREVRDTTRDTSRQLSSHGEELIRHSAQLADHDRRLADVEGWCDPRRSAGGTD